MGTRFGIIAATASEEDLLAELNRHVGELVLDGTLEEPYDALDEGHTGWELAIGERDGKSFVLDGTFVLSNSPDMLRAMSARLGLVVGAGADTMFGSFWFTAARDGELVRFMSVDPESTTQGMAIGEALPSEAEHRIDGDFDGGGLFAAMATLGVDPRSWRDNGPARLLAPVGRRYPEPGEIERIRSEHTKRYQQARLSEEIVDVQDRLRESIRFFNAEAELQGIPLVMGTETPIRYTGRLATDPLTTLGQGETRWPRGSARRRPGNFNRWATTGR